MKFDDSKNVRRNLIFGAYVPRWATTTSAATLDGDFPVEGYYSLQAVASLSFYNSRGNLVSGPYSSSGQTDGNDYIGQ